MSGEIYSAEAYAQGKMLDHSSWQDHPTLPRGITPSDIDVVFDNAGNVLFVELSSSTAKWADLAFGQRRVYEAVIWETKHCAIVCRHNVSLQDGRRIDSRQDIIACQPMLFDDGAIWVCPVIEGNSKWQGLVRQWYEHPLYVRQVLAVRAKETVWKTDEL